MQSVGTRGALREHGVEGERRNVGRHLGGWATLDTVGYFWRDGLIYLPVLALP